MGWRDRQGGHVLVADDHPPTRQGLSRAATAALPGVTVVGVGTVADAVAQVATRGRFRLALVDLRLPDARGLSPVLSLHLVDPGVPVVIVAAREDPALAAAARALGAAGLLAGGLPPDAIAARLRAIDAGHPGFPAEIVPSAAVAAARARIGNLSPAQYRVLIALVDGRSNKEIARALDVSEATVKAHLSAIFRRLGVTRRADALLAIRPLLGDVAPAAP